MQWVAPAEKDAATDTLEKRLWDAADQFRANSSLSAAQYSQPVLGLIFLRFAEVRFSQQRIRLEEAGASSRRGSRVDDPTAYHAEGILFLPPNSRFDYLLNLPEAADIGAKVNDAMRDIEKHNSQLSGVLPKTYNIFTSTLLKGLLKLVSEIPATLDYDAFGRIYEYFLGEFAMTEGQGGGEFYTPSSIVKLLAEVIEPFHGRILDPACGSGGMFVQSARFVSEHKKNPSSELSIFGVEKTDETGRLCRMNLAVHGLEGDIKHGGQTNSYYDDPHEAVGKFDFVLANPPFNVNAVDKDRLKEMVGAGRRYPFGLPNTDNGNYLWIQLFYSSLNPKGRAGFVMANSASDARSSEMELRKKLIESRAVDVMVAVGPNMFYTVTLPCTLWFLSKAKATLSPPSTRLGSHPSPSGRRVGDEGEQNRGNTVDGLPFSAGRRVGDEGEQNRGNTVDGLPSSAGRRAGDEGEQNRGNTVDGLPFSAGRRVGDESEQNRGNTVDGLPFSAGRRVGDEGEQNRGNTVLFIDARHIYRQVDRAHREWTPAQIGFIANVVRLYRGEDPDFTLGGGEAEAKLKEVFGFPSPAGRGIKGEGAGKVAYRDVPGLCNCATLKEIEAQGWSLNPGRYVGVAPGETVSDEDFKEQLEDLNEELENLNAQARELEATIARNVAEILEA